MLNLCERDLARLNKIVTDYKHALILQHDLKRGGSKAILRALSSLEDGEALPLQARAEEILDARVERLTKALADSGVKFTFYWRDGECYAPLPRSALRVVETFSGIKEV